MSPLAFAVVSMRLENIKLLIKAGADVNAKTVSKERSQHTILQLACRNHRKLGGLEILLELIWADADTNCLEQWRYEFRVDADPWEQIQQAISAKACVPLLK